MNFGDHTPDDVSSFFHNGGTISQLREHDPKQLMIMHQYALQLLDKGDYRGARNLFQLLVVCEHTNPEYQLGFGASHQLTGDHQSAVLFLAQAAQLLVSDPRPHWLLARSAIELKQYDDAHELLNNAISLAGKQTQWEQLIYSAMSDLKKCDVLKGKNK
ncbi:hypothetical protein D5952_14065 [Salmonella enterica subsp. enterica]|nr:hypothetical protein [Salmonella enterica subsp. enterica serovar Bonn]EBZ5939306.1 hypothetical protein [Salmonella enterica subsp. enterica serovar Muenchen]MLZ41049.1 hypothetical protein [Salmonella enterica subsp. enterica serovar Bonn]